MNTLSDTARAAPPRPFFLWRHLNKLRWATLSVVFATLVLLPFLHIYQTYVAAHAYDLLAPSEQTLYDVMEAITAPFIDDPAEDLGEFDSRSVIFKRGEPHLNKARVFRR